METPSVPSSITRRAGGIALFLLFASLLSDRAKAAAGDPRPRDPLLRGPADLDLRLRPTSPCRGKAADGGDLGCRLTPQMSEMIKLALDLRRRGVIDLAPLALAQ